MELKRAGAFTIGEWRVEPSLNRLSKAERRQTIQPQAMELLVFLAERRGDVVSSDEIIRHVWAGRPISDNPVYKTITKLRRALSDDARCPAYIETVTKRGYRLIAAVGEAHEPRSESKVPEFTADARPEPSPRVPAKRSRLVWFWAAVALVAAAFWLFRASFPTLERAADPTLRQVVSLPGSSSQASIAPDGERVAFVNDIEGIESIWVLELETGTTERLTEGRAPTWAPDGERLLFERARDVWLLDVGESPARLISHAAQPAWSYDGTRIAFERGTEVWIARDDGREQRRIEWISNREQLFAPRSPAFSRDGTKLAYFETTDGPHGDIWIVDIETGVKARLTFDDARAGHPSFTHDGEWIVFESKRGGSQSIWRVALDGGAPERLIPGSGDDSQATLSPDGTRVIYTNARARWSLVVSDSASGTSEVLFESRHQVVAPELSPDQSRIAFFAEGTDGSAHVFVQPVSGGQPTQLTHGARSLNAMPKWSRDGSWLYFYHAAESRSWRRISSNGGESEVVVRGWAFNKEHDATLAPAGDKVLYARLEGNEVIETRIKDLLTGQEVPLGRRISWPDWSPDGARVLGTDFSSDPIPVGPVVLCLVAGENSGDCNTLAPRGQHAKWTADGDAAFFVEPLDDDALQLWYVDLRALDTRKVMRLAPTWEMGPFFDVTSDGRVVWVRYEPGRAELWQASW